MLSYLFIVCGFVSYDILTLTSIPIPRCSIAAGFYILLQAVDRFAANYNSFPGQFDG